MQGLPEIGDVLDDTYKVEKLIGTGGFGAVYLARQLSMDRKVALKILVANAMNIDEMIQRFRREVMACRNLGHPNTIRIYDFRDRPDGILYYTMEYVNGPTLKDVIKDDGPMPPARVAHILKQICKSLAEAHSFNIVHRDLKPANIMLADIAGETDFVKVVDFGIAKIVDDGNEERDQLTNAGVLVGTLNYMSPEQIQGGDIGPVSDLYALGLIAIEMLMGESVFAGTGRWEVLHKQISDEPVDIPEEVLESELGDLLSKALEKKASDRFGSAEEMLKALGTLRGLPDEPLIAAEELESVDGEIDAEDAAPSGSGNVEMPESVPVESEPPLPEPVRAPEPMRTESLDEPTSPGEDDEPDDETDGPSDDVEFSEAPTSLHDSGVSPNPLHQKPDRQQQFTPAAVQVPDREPVVSPMAGDDTQQADRRPNVSPMPGQGAFAPGDTDMGPAPSNNKTLIAVAGVVIVLVVIAGIVVSQLAGGDDPVDDTPVASTDQPSGDPVAVADPPPSDPALDNVVEPPPEPEVEPDGTEVPMKTIRLLTPGVKAQVLEEEELIGETPLRFPVGIKKSYTLRAEGYEEQQVQLSNESEEVVDVRLERVSVAARDKPSTDTKPTKETTKQPTTKQPTTKQPTTKQPTTKKPSNDWVDINKKDKKPKSEVPVF